MPDLLRELARTNWGWAAGSAALGLLGLWARARRWRYFFPPRSRPPALLAAMMIGYMANNVLPLRAGEVVRVYVVARRWGHGFWLIVATLVVERVLDSLSIVLILALLMLLIPVPSVLQWAALGLLAIDLLGTAVLLALAVAPAACRSTLQRWTARWPAVERRALRIFDTFVRGLDGIRTRAHLLPLLAWTVVIWVLPALAAWTMLRAMHLALSWLAGWTVLAFVGLGISLPSAPGYIGVFHAAAALALTIFGVPQHASVGYALVFHATQFLPVTVVGWLFLLREHVSLGEATHARPSVD